jgi:hypothetical protein
MQQHLTYVQILCNLKKLEIQKESKDCTGLIEAGD